MDCPPFGEGEIPRPGYWRGYRLAPEQIEFWQNGDFRLHDNLQARFVHNHLLHDVAIVCAGFGSPQRWTVYEKVELRPTRVFSSDPRRRRSFSRMDFARGRRANWRLGGASSSSRSRGGLP